MIKFQPLSVSLLLSLALLVGCPGDPDDDSAGDDDAGDDDDGGPVEYRFTLGVIADPHVTGNVEHAERLDAAVAWMNDHASERDIRFVVVLGDIGWNSGIDTVKPQLDALSMPYVPITGDNEIHAGDEEAFFDTFTPQWELLSTTLDGWQMATMPVDNPVAGKLSWFNNFSFDYEGVHFIGLDWCVRGDHGLLGDTGDLHDFEGGSFQFWEDDLAGREGDPQASIVLLTHIPMQILMFDIDELEKVYEVMTAVGDAHYGNLAGHVHIDATFTEADGLYELITYDATWDDDVTVGLVEVSGNDQRFEYHHELHIVPFGG